MATWHQSRQPVNLYHPEKYTVVNDPPGKTLTVARFSDEKLASEHAQATGGYILPPQPQALPNI